MHNDDYNGWEDYIEKPLETADTCPECGAPQRWVCRGVMKPKLTFLRCSKFPKCKWKKGKIK